jgi:hypothetical protein
MKMLKRPKQSCILVLKTLFQEYLNYFFVLLKCLKIILSLIIMTITIINESYKKFQ